MRLPFILLLTITLAFGCSNHQKPASEDSLIDLEKRSADNQTPSLWDTALFNSDVEAFDQLKDVFQELPISCSPFPVTSYDFAVTSVPFEFKISNESYLAVTIGEFVNSDEDSIIERLTIVYHDPDTNGINMHYVSSRNFPYLTAQGFFSEGDGRLNWVFQSTPDGFSSLIVNMKLFDLRFGKTVILLPQKDGAFTYLQLDEVLNSSNLESHRSILEEKIGTFNSNY